ncbi:MAG: DUF5684 domain-containing protein [Clostridium sp.]|uniref:DUF5684 domain-containing protein n=1 Tax=Clostridium sp. TaxID=1506 RepID=UPI003F2EC34C
MEYFDASWIAGTFFTTTSLIIGLLLYVISAYPLYVMARKADMKNPGFMFIPILNTIKLYNLANMSGWFFLLTFIPIIGWIVPIVVLYKVFDNFDFSLIGIIFGIIFSVIGFWYIALSSKKRYVAQLDSKYRA